MGIFDKIKRIFNIGSKKDQVVPPEKELDLKSQEESIKKPLTVKESFPTPESESEPAVRVPRQDNRLRRRLHLKDEEDVAET